MKLFKKIKKKFKKFLKKIMERRRNNEVDNIVDEDFDDYIDYYVEDYDDYEEEFKKDDKELSDEDIKIISYSLKRNLPTVKKQEKNNDICSICLLEKYKEVRTFVCSHSFCQDCVVGWYIKKIKSNEKPMCPICLREDYYIDDFFPNI